jgi:signal transduction histidine kinase
MVDSIVSRQGPIVDVVEHGATVRLGEGLQVEGAQGMTSSLLVPFAGPAGAAGALVVAVAETRGIVWPADEDVEAMRGFADQAALALERAQSRQDRADLAVLADRDRIARDLHDLVIQRLFATGLSLQGVSRRVDQDDVRDRLRNAVDELDVTIREIRGAIFELSHPERDDDLRTQLRDVVAAARGSSGLAPRLELVGPVESAVPDTVRPHLVAVLVEALSNAVRHAGATQVDARVDVTDGRVSLEVADDGTGFTPTGRESGLRNMRSRAAAVGGGCVVDSTRETGTTVRWWAPLE